MTLNPTTPRPVPAARLSLTWAVVVGLVVGGVAITGTAAYYTIHPVVQNHTVTSPPPAVNKSKPPTELNITDDLGRSVTVPFDPARVVVLGPSIMDTMYRLGLRSHVVGVDCYAAALGGLSDDYSPDQVALWNLSSSMCVQVGPSFAPETLVNLTPQLVLAATFISIADVQTITNQLGVPVVMIQPPTLSGIQVDVDLLGEIFNVTRTADVLSGELAGALYNTTNETSNFYVLPTVLVTYDADSQGYWTFGPGTFGESLIEFVGATSISANSTTAYPELSPAQVLYDDPSWIIYGTGFGLNLSSYQSGPDWSDFGAVTAGNVSGLNSNWLTEPDPTMILEGIPALLAILHPGAP
jgi:iron complex transport system substrate-binding protein